MSKKKDKPEMTVEEQYKKKAFDLLKSAFDKGDDYSAVVDKLKAGSMDIKYPAFTSRLQRKNLPLWWVMQIAEALDKEIQIVDKK